MVAALEAGAGPEIVTWPMLLAGLGIGALASQLGAVTVSSVPDEQSSEVGGLQNTGTNLGASIGTALAGAVLISTLTTSFLTGIEENPDVPAEVTASADGRAAGGRPVRLRRRPARPRSTTPGVPADHGRRHRRRERRRPASTALRASLSVLAVIALIALFFSRRLPARQLASSPSP